MSTKWAEVPEDNRESVSYYWNSKVIWKLIRIGRWGFFDVFIVTQWGGFIWLGVRRVLVGSRIGWWWCILELWLKRYRGEWYTSGSFWARVHSWWLVQWIAVCCGWLWWHIWWVTLRAHWVLYKSNCQRTRTKEATYCGTSNAQNYSQGTATDTWSRGCRGHGICRDNNMINNYWKLPGEEAAWHHVHMHGTHNSLHYQHRGSSWRTYSCSLSHHFHQSIV